MKEISYIEAVELAAHAGLKNIYAAIPVPVHAISIEQLCEMNKQGALFMIKEKEKIPSERSKPEAAIVPEVDAEPEALEEKIEVSTIEPDVLEEKIEVSTIEPDVLEEKIEVSTIEPEALEEKIEVSTIEPEQTEEPTKKRRTSNLDINTRDVAEMEIKGMKNNEIADALGVDKKQMQNWRVYHRKDIEKMKQQLHEITELAKKVLE